MAYASERRGEKRNLFTVTVELTVLDGEKPTSQCIQGYGLTTNKSIKGLGLITNCPVNEGQSVTLSGNKLSDNLLTGSVMWCSRISEGIYRVGLKLD